MKSPFNFFKLASVLFFFPFITFAGSVSYTSNSTFTVPAGVTQIVVTGSGAGGSGGMYRDTPGIGTYSGAGGGSGGYVNNQIISVTPGSSHAVQVGSGATVLGSLLTLGRGGDATLTLAGAGGIPNGGAGDSPFFYADSWGSPTVAPGGGGGSGIGTGGSAGYIGTYVMGDCQVDPATDGFNGGGGAGASYCYQDGRLFDAPPSNGGAGFLTIAWLDPTVGTIQVNSNVAGAGWTITGPSPTITGSGLTANYTNRTTGSYTIVWSDVSGYTKPSNQSLTLNNGATITFNGTYAVNAPSCTYQLDTFPMQNDYYEVRFCNHVAPGKTACDPTPNASCGGVPFFPAALCPGGAVAGGVSSAAHGSVCRIGSSQTVSPSGFVPEPGACYARRLRTICTGSPATVDLNLI